MKIPRIILKCIILIGLYNYQSIAERKLKAMAQEKRKYMKIGYEERLELINLIKDQGYTISDAAKKLGVKESTARAIYINYRDNSIVFQKKDQRQQRLLAQRPQKQNKQVEKERKQRKQSEVILENRDIHEENNPMYGYFMFVVPENTFFFPQYQ